MDHARTFIAFFASLLLTLVPMSDSDLDLFPEEPDLRIDDRAEVASFSHSHSASDQNRQQSRAKPNRCKVPRNGNLP